MGQNFAPMIRQLLALFLLAGNLMVWAQPPVRTCGTMDYLEAQKKQDPSLEFQMEQIEEFTRRFSRKNSRAVTGVITIPVVVHVVYNTADENISDAQIQSQIDILNEDFRRLNGDADNVWSQAADSEIEFCLASRDPNGNPSTGITRTETTKTSFDQDNTMKFDATGGKDAWPRDSYLNIWVCDLDGLLGYAQFPGGSAATDGVVCTYDAFGDIGTAAFPFDLGRTATHEVGHWLNLRHIWGDGDCGFDDFVADTPISDDHNYGCEIGHISCNTLDMVQNYMDYSDDACMNLFTLGQKDRMRVLFEAGGPRESLLSSIGCEPPGSLPNLTREEGFSSLTVNGTDVTVSIRVINNGSVTAGASTVRYYMSTDPTFATSVYELGSDPVGSLPPGSTSDESISVDASTLGAPSGDYYIAYFIDADNVVVENNETDNGFYWTSPQVVISGGTPNLTLALEFAGLSVNGTNVNVSIRVINNGNAVAGASTVRYFLSADAFISLSDYEIGSDPVGNLASGAGSDESIAVDVGVLGIPDGNYFIGFIIDADENVSESDESDNHWYWESPQVTINSSDCQEVDIEQSVVLTEGTHEFRAENTITASDEVFSGVSANYYAGTSITFEPGTHFRSGSSILATIEDCSPEVRLADTHREPEHLLHFEEAEAVQLKAFPNPVNHQTTIEYSLPEGGKVNLGLYDLFGRQIQTLVNGERQDPGVYKLDLSTTAFSPGTYFLVLQSADVRQNLRLIVLH